MQNVLSDAGYAQLLREVLEGKRLVLSAKSSPMSVELSNIVPSNQ